MPHLDDYLQHLTFERGLSTNTLKSYTRDIQLLQGLAQESDLANIQNTQIRRFIATLHSRGLSSKSIARALSEAAPSTTDSRRRFSRLAEAIRQ